MQKVLEEFPARKQLAVVKPDLAAAVPVTVGDGFSCEQGDVLGKAGGTGFYRRRSVTEASGDGFSNASPVGTVADATVFQPGDVLVGGGDPLGTVSAIDESTNQVTLTANATNDAAAGTDVMASDGSQIAEVIADASSDGVGEATIAAVVTGILDLDQIRGLDVSAIAELGGASRAGLFIF